MNLQAGEMINQKLSPDLESVRLVWGRIPWGNLRWLHATVDFNPKNMMEVLVNQGKLQGLRWRPRNLTSLELKVDVQDIQNERLKPLQERAVWQTFFKTVVSAQLEQFQKFHIRPQEPKNGNAFIEMSPKKTPLTTRPTFSNPFHCHPFHPKYKPLPLPPSAKRRGRLQRGNERWRLERYSATSFLEGSEPTTLGWLFGRRCWRFVFFKNVPKNGLWGCFSLFEIWLILEFENKTKLFGEFSETMKPCNLESLWFLFQILGTQKIQVTPLQRDNFCI